MSGVTCTSIVRVTRGGSLVHSARVIVGKPNTPTPVFSNRMRFLEVNPYWNVPESIIKNEMMPRIPRTPLPRMKRSSNVSSWSSAW